MRKLWLQLVCCSLLPACYFHQPPTLLWNKNKLEIRMKESGTASFVESTFGSHMNAVLTYFVFSFVFFTPWKSGTVTESTFQLVVYDVNNLKNQIESQCCKVRGIPWWVCSCFYLKTVNSNRTYVGYSPWTEARDVWCSPPPPPPTPI